MKPCLFSKARYAERPSSRRRLSFSSPRPASCSPSLLRPCIAIRASYLSQLDAFALEKTAHKKSLAFLSWTLRVLAKLTCLITRQFSCAQSLGSHATKATLACHRRKCFHCLHIQAGLDSIATIQVNPSPTGRVGCLTRTFSIPPRRKSQSWKSPRPCPRLFR